MIEESSKYIMNTYSRFPVVLEKGRGVNIWSVDGKRYTDFFAGLAVNVLGHCYPRLVVAMQKQTQRLIHISNFYHNEMQINFARLLVKNSFAEKVFFSNSGSEANEAAVKLARKYSKEKIGYEKNEIITTLNSYHGRTLAMTSATGQNKIQQGFEPLTPGFKYVPYNDIDALSDAVNERTCAIMLEPVQGEGGVIVPSREYLPAVRKLCNEKGVLLILDEVQTGMGRTGKLFAYEHFGVRPDIMSLAKSLGGGMPIGATLATEEVASAFSRGSHDSTFGGNPLACAAGIATLESILEDGILLQECMRIGGFFMESLEGLKSKHPDIVSDVRGLGLLIGMELSRGCMEVVQACFERGYLINLTGNNTLRFCPPLIVTKNDIKGLTSSLDEVLGRLS